MLLMSSGLGAPKPFRRFKQFGDSLLFLDCAVFNVSPSAVFILFEDGPPDAVNMPAKGVSTRLNPVRLQTIPHLRIRRPNQHEQNSCATVMSSMLSMFGPWVGLWATAGRV